jgi:hypothetical protein
MIVVLCAYFPPEGIFATAKQDTKTEIKKDIAIKGPVQKTGSGIKKQDEIDIGTSSPGVDEINSAIIDSVKIDAEKSIKELDGTLKELYWEDISQLMDAYKRIKKTLIVQKKKAIVKDMSDNNRKIWDSYLDHMLILIDDRIEYLENAKKESKKNFIDYINSFFGKRDTIWTSNE